MVHIGLEKPLTLPLSRRERGKRVSQDPHDGLLRIPLFQRKGRHAKCCGEDLAVVKTWFNFETFDFQELWGVLNLVQVTHELLESHTLHLDLDRLFIIYLAWRAYR